jgi:hypothetical protein
MYLNYSIILIEYFFFNWSISCPTIYPYKIFDVINTNLLMIYNGELEARAELLAPFYVMENIESYDL